MFNVIFIPKRKTRIGRVSYLVNQELDVIAATVAKVTFMQEHNFRYYDKIQIEDVRVL